MDSSKLFENHKKGLILLRFTHAQVISTNRVGLDDILEKTPNFSPKYPNVSLTPQISTLCIIFSPMSELYFIAVSIHLD